VNMTRKGSKLFGVVIFQLQIQYGDTVSFVGVVLYNYQLIHGHEKHKINIAFIK
jgi:hypothetical protein